MRMVPKQSELPHPLKSASKSTRFSFPHLYAPGVFTTLYSPRFLARSLLGKIGNYMCVHLGRRKPEEPEELRRNEERHRKKTPASQSSLSSNRYKVGYSSLQHSLLLQHQHTFARSYICAISITIDLTRGLSRSNNFNARTLRKPPKFHL